MRCPIIKGLHKNMTNKQDTNCKEDKKTQLKAVVIYGWCMSIWICKVILEVAYKDYVTRPKIFVADIVCTVWFIVIFVLWLKKYKESNTDKQ